MSEDSKNVSKIKEFWKNNEQKAILLLGLVLIIIAAFEGGYLKGKTVGSNPIVIEKASLGQKTALGDQSDSEVATNTLSKDNSLKTDPLTKNNECVFVGSKNSNKYHLPTCRWAKQIKPENVVCFSSAEEAAGRGYQPDKNCIK